MFFELESLIISTLRDLEFDSRCLPNATWVEVLKEVELGSPLVEQAPIEGRIFGTNITITISKRLKNMGYDVDPGRIANAMFGNFKNKRLPEGLKVFLAENTFINFEIDDVFAKSCVADLIRMPFIYFIDKLGLRLERTPLVSIYNEIIRKEGRLANCKELFRTPSLFDQNLNNYQFRSISPYTKLASRKIVIKLENQLTDFLLFIPFLLIRLCQHQNDEMLAKEMALIDEAIESLNTDPILRIAFSNMENPVLGINLQNVNSLLSWYFSLRRYFTK